MMRDEDRVDEQLSAYVDGELDSEARAEVEALLRRSPEARARFDRFLAVSQGLRELASPELPPGLESGLRRRIEAEARPVSRRAAAPSRRRRFAVAAFAAAAAAAALALALLPRSPRDADRTPPIARQATPTPPEPAPRKEPEPLRPAPERLAEGRGMPAPPDVAPTPEELLLVSDLERPEDLEVIELLDWLGELDALDRGGRG